jgi:hypothetical protein
MVTELQGAEQRLQWVANQLPGSGAGEVSLRGSLEVLAEAVEAARVAMGVVKTSGT